MYSFIIDTQLPPRLSRYLSKKGLDSKHTTDFPNGHLLKDLEISQIAIQEGRIIITKDQDFFDNYLVNGSPPKVIQLQFGNMDNQTLLHIFEVNLESIQTLLNNGAEMILFSQERIVEYEAR